MPSPRGQVYSADQSPFDAYCGCRAVADCPVEEETEEAYVPRRKRHRGAKFRLPVSHMKASGSILCIVPLKGTVKKSDNADDLITLKSNLKKLLDIDGLLFYGATVNGEMIRTWKY